MKGPLELGVVGRPHGLAGEVKVKLHNTSSDTLFEVDRVEVVVGGARRELRIERIRRSPKGAIALFEGVDDRDGAEALRGARLFVAREALPPLEEGEFFLADLVGVRVVGPEGEIGRIREVVSHPTLDSVVIELPDGSRVEQALVEPWLESVDVDEGVVTLASTDGLI